MEVKLTYESVLQKALKDHQTEALVQRFLDEEILAQSAFKRLQNEVLCLKKTKSLDAQKNARLNEKKAC